MNNPKKKLDVASFLASPHTFLQKQMPADHELKRLFAIACGKKNLGLALLLLNHWIGSDSENRDREARTASDLDLNVKNIILHLICENGTLTAECSLRESLLESPMTEYGSCSGSSSENKKETRCDAVHCHSDFWELQIQDLVTQILNGPIGDEKLFTLGIRFYCSVGSYGEGKVLFRNLMNSGEKPHIRTFLPLLEASPDLDQIQGWHRLAREHATKPPNQEFYECFFRRLLQLAPASQKSHLFLEAFRIFRTYHMYLSPSVKRVITDTWSLENVNIRADGRIMDDNGLFRGCLKSEDIPEARREEFIDGLYKKHQTRFQKFDSVMQKRGFIWDVVFDGANIALYNNSEFRPDRLYRLARWSMKRDWKVLLILHTKRRHAGIEQFVREHSSQMQIFYTPIGFNDDHYWIYAALSRNCYIVSNDEMRDHIFQNFNDEAFRIWKERHRITYHFDREQTDRATRGGSGRGRGPGRGGKGRGEQGRGSGRDRGRSGRGKSDNWSVFLPPPYSRSIQIHQENLEKLGNSMKDDRTSEGHEALDCPTALEHREGQKALKKPKTSDVVAPRTDHSGAQSNPQSTVQSIYLPIYDPEKWGEDYLQNLVKIQGWCLLRF